MYLCLSLWCARKPGRAISLKNQLNLSEIQLWKEKLVAQSGGDEHPAVSTQCQALIKTCGNFAYTFVPVKLSLLSL